MPPADRHASLAEVDTQELEIGALTNLSPEKRRTYAALWRAHVHPRLGNRELCQLRPGALHRLRDELLEDGVSPDSIRATLVLVESVFRNRPDAEAPFGQPERDPQLWPFEPREVERLRAALGARDATLVSLLAYAGLRPGEILALRWSDVERGTLRVDGRAQAVRGHTRVESVRQVRLLAPLAADLAAWRTRHGDVDADELVIPGPDGGAWSDDAFSEWKRQRFAPAVKAAGLPIGTRPYDLRHTFVWLLLREGASMADVARETGYSATTALRIYRQLAARAHETGHRLAPEAIAVARVA
jgi:integrase